MQNNLIHSMLPRVDSLDLVTTLPQHEQCFKSEAKHDLNTMYFGSSRTLFVSSDIELHEEDACEISKFSQSSSHAVTDDGNESDLSHELVVVVGRLKSTYVPTAYILLV